MCGEILELRFMFYTVICIAMIVRVYPIVTAITLVY